MDTVLPLVHSTPTDEQLQEADEPEQTAGDASMQSYVAINPALLFDSRWAYRDLQLLCQRLGLGGRGDRLHLIHKLRTWNRTHFSSSSTLPTTSASNFALLCIDSGGDKYAAQLTPLKVKTPRLCDGSPRSALSGGRGAMAGAASEGRRLSFSVFNGVKIIPPRTLVYDDEQKEQEQHNGWEAQAEKRDQQIEMAAASLSKDAMQAATNKSAATTASTLDASCKSASRADSQVPRCVADSTSVSEQRMMEPRETKHRTIKCDDSNNEQQQATNELTCLSLRRSARKRVPSRKVRDGQCEMKEMRLSYCGATIH